MHGVMEHSRHFGWTIFSHLARLSGLARLLVAALAANVITPLGTEDMMLCHAISDSSWIRRVAFGQIVTLLLFVRCGEKHKI